ncbi:MAG: DAK2 domain-containing protein [Coriobacteriia bacterium]|nr:DAK2 domain-containing protein [Coriobacteriia bacterium]
MRHENTIDGSLLRKMLLSGFDTLSHNKAYLDEQNVFPVSDCDTGTNMRNTFESGIAALKDGDSFHEVFSAFVKGMLIGSRGNSGFILSQYFFGILEYTRDKETVSVAELSAALQHACEVAYSAVLHPAEGTMLTVMRNGAGRTLARAHDQAPLTEFFDLLTEEMFLCTQETVKQMDLLRDNNVVDSGALGLYLVFDGMRSALHDDGQRFDCEQNDALPRRVPDLAKNISFFRYCTEFILKIRDQKDKDFFVRALEKRGDSIVAAIDEDILKVHIHSNLPQEIMNEFSAYGSIITRKVDDLFLTEEFERLKQRKYEDFAVVAFTRGEGMAATFEQLGADVAFDVPFGYFPSEDELKILIDEFSRENLIIFCSDKKLQERFRRIKWFSNLQNLYVADSDDLIKTFFMLSSVIFVDEFNNVTASLESMKKQRVFQTKIFTTAKKDQVQYSGRIKNKRITKNTLVELLRSVASKEILYPCSTVVAFGGYACRPDDVEAICAHFEENSDVEFSWYEGGQHDCAFIIGAS